MRRETTGCRLIVNADDFGWSTSVNDAVVGAHKSGILTTASLMVNGHAFDAAVSAAARHPGLGVGLHLALVQSPSTLPSERIPGLVDARGEFDTNPVRAGWRYFFDRRLRAPLEREIEAQVRKFRSTGLVMDHLNGHLHLHLHPVVLEILLRNRVAWGIERIRLVHDPLLLNLRLVSGNGLSRISHGLIFLLLRRYASPRIRAAGLRHPDRVYGLLQNGQMNEAYLLKLLPRLGRGSHEIYAHPCLDRYRHEYEALVSARVRESLEALGVRRIRYQDLEEP